MRRASRYAGCMTAGRLIRERATRSRRIQRTVWLVGLVLLLATIAGVALSRPGAALSWPTTIWVVDVAPPLTGPPRWKAEEVRGTPENASPLSGRWFRTTGTSNGVPFNGIHGERRQSLVWQLIQQLGFDRDDEWQVYIQTDETRDADGGTWRRYDALFGNGALR